MSWNSFTSDGSRRFLMRAQELAALVGAVKHSHLANTYLRLPPDELKLALASGPYELGATAGLLRTIAVRLDSGLDPAQVVESEYVESLQSIHQSRVADTLRRAYLEALRPEEAGARLIELCEQLEAIGAQLLASPGGTVEEVDSVKELRSVAQSAIAELASMPRIIWIPS
jgi:hypothetical protein